MQLLGVSEANVRPSKFYYIRVRNRDIHGLKLDYIGKINVVDNDGISFDSIFYHEPGKKWKQLRRDERVLILRDSEDTTTFYIAP